MIKYSYYLLIMAICLLPLESFAKTDQVIEFTLPNGSILTNPTGLSIFSEIKTVHASNQLIYPISIKENKSYHYIDDFEERMMQEGVDYSDLSKYLESDYFKKLKSLNKSATLKSIEKIPLITHMIYLFKDDSTKTLSQNNIQKVVRTTNELNRIDPDWKHYFWTNNSANIDPEIKVLKNLNIVDFSEFNGHKLYGNLINLLNKANMDADPIPSLTQASDVLRLMIVQRYGGVYHDVDYEIFKPVLFNKLINKFSLILTQESLAERDVANFIIASTPNHEVINTAIDMIHRNLNESSPRYITHAKDKINQLVYETGPCVLSVAFFKYAERVKNNFINNHYMFFMKGGLTNHELARSTEPLNEKCKSTSVAAVQQDIYFRGQIVPTIGADTMCGSWGAAQGFDKQLKYYSIASKNNVHLECGLWDKLPHDLQSSNYSMHLNNEDYICGAKKQ